MKSRAISCTAVALLLSLLSTVAEAGHGKLHNARNLNLKHHHHHKSHSDQKRTGNCPFPEDAGLVSITPGSQNAGWAMSPDEPCEPGNYCPYACPPGMVMGQWDPDATSYTYPASMNGGLYCDESGQVSKPFPENPYCVDATGALSAKNKAGDVVSFCQTVLPGNEAMLIPTKVTDLAELAVPDPSYWCSTAAHYYINPPGVGTDDACVWGSEKNPWGNWSPYVAGANTDDSGNTFVKLGWNPIYLEPATPFRDESPTFGVKIECDGDCNGLPCGIDPAKNSVNAVSGSSTEGAGGADFCVVTVPKGTTANIVVFGSGDEGGGSSPSPSEPSSPAAEPGPTTPSPPPSPSPETTPTPGPSSPAASSPPAYASEELMPHVMVEVSGSSMPSASITKPSDSSSSSFPTTEATPSTTGGSGEGAASTTSVPIVSLLFSLMAAFVCLNF